MGRQGGILYSLSTSWKCQSFSLYFKDFTVFYTMTVLTHELHAKYLRCQALCRHANSALQALIAWQEKKNKRHKLMQEILVVYKDIFILSTVKEQRVQSLSFQDQRGSNPKQSAWPQSWPFHLWMVGLATSWVLLAWNYVELSSFLFSLFGFFFVFLNFIFPLLVWNRWNVNNLRGEDNIFYSGSLYFFYLARKKVIFQWITFSIKPASLTHIFWCF